MSNHHRCPPGLVERVALIIEECAEVSQVCTKILRHGLDSHHPVSRLTNKELLERELGDLLAVIPLLMAIGDIEERQVRKHQAAKVARVVQYLHNDANKTYFTNQMGDKTQ